MGCLHLEECLKPGISQSLKNWICFTNQHHNGHRTHDETVKAFQGTTIAEFIDFEKLAILSLPKPEIEMGKNNASVTIVFNDAEVAELFNLLEKNKDEHPDLHEKVYQAMFKTLMNRIG